MDSKVIFNNEYLTLTSNWDGVYIETHQKGFSFDKLNSILSAHPEIEINNFTALKLSINNAPKPPEKIGRIKERISIELLDNDMKATVTLNVPAEELKPENRTNLSTEVMEKLDKLGVIGGIKSDALLGELKPCIPHIIAEGIRPVDGSDSIVQTYEMHEIKPEVDQDASVDFYDLRLINSVKAGEWLGERMDATDGTPGKTVKGGSVTPVKGKNYPILYDKSNIAEVYENKKTTLYSKINGAVSYVDGKISVSNHLEINGDVNFSTGNINFDGYVTIKGTVSDGFSVVATKDIEINSDLGLGNVKEIVSTKGSVYIRGGIASKKQTIIKAAKSVYTKFVDNTVITAGDSVHIGFYCINSFIEAKELVMDSMKGQIIGGNIRTEIRVSAPIIGSEMERKTIIEVTGFDKEAIKNELEKTFQKIVELKKEQQQLKLALTHLDGKGELNPFQRKEYNDQTERLYSIKDEIKELEEKRKNDSYYLKTHGNGEICIGKKIYPNCTLIIQKNFIEITSPVSSTTYYVQDNQIKQVT